MTWRERLMQVIHSWEGTPWIDGQQLRGRGVDCVRFVVGVLDELYRYDKPPVPVLPQHLGLHNRSDAIKATHAIASRYPHVVVTEPEPGDIVVVNIGEQGGPGHVAIFGDPPRLVWHAVSKVGVCFSSASSITRIYKIWRPLEKELWQQQ